MRRPIGGPERRLLLFSALAFYPIHWEAFRWLCDHYAVRGLVITQGAPALPTVHQQLGWASAGQAQAAGVEVAYLPQANPLVQAAWLHRQLWAWRPDAIWVQEEPVNLGLLQILLHYRLSRQPRIVTAVCENIFGRRPLFPVDQARQWLWARLDGLLAVAQPSVDGIRAVGMPAQVPAQTLVAGALLPPEAVTPLELPCPRAVEDFVVGFAGRICEEKGWKVLLAAMEQLPLHFKCLIAGDGVQRDELSAWLRRPGLQGRVFALGLLSKAELWRFYAALNCLVLPSLTTPRWKEQFGGVLADGMALGLPLVGSDSGAIAEVMGPAGRAVPEGDPQALAQALHQLQAAPGLCEQLGRAGRLRFEAEFAIPAYARKIATALALPPRA